MALPDAIALVAELEERKAATEDLQQWKTKLASGVAKFSQFAAINRMFPPMFVWVVVGAGEDLAAGFRRAGEIYHSRAIYRTEVALFSVLPFASLFLWRDCAVAGFPGPKHVFTDDFYGEQFELISMEDFFIYLLGILWYMVLLLLPGGAFVILLHYLLSLPMQRRDRALFFLGI